VRAALSAFSAVALALAPASYAQASCSAAVEIGVLSYDPLGGEPGRLPAALDLRCSGLTQTTSLQVSISGGTSGDAAHRTLVDGASHVLHYSIVLPDGQPWGDGTNGTSPYTVSVQSRHVRIPFVAIVPAGQTIGPGGYSDELTVTLEY
jgi:spore coat protein U-like protein